jgi:hypothetical protein
MIIHTHTHTHTHTRARAHTHGDIAARVCMCVCAYHTHTHTQVCSALFGMKKSKTLHVRCMSVACPCMVLEMGVGAAGLLGNPFILFLNISYEMAIGLEREREGERERESFFSNCSTTRGLGRLC